MAYYRQHATFVGVDGARTQVAIADEKRTTLGLANVSFVASDFQSAAVVLSGRFDFIIAHGVFSWVSHDARDALMRLCAGRLVPGGLLYVNYNASPGWNVRGLIREFLLSQTAKVCGLRARALRAREIAARVAEELRNSEHPYSRLLGDEFRLVGENHLSYTAHEYLAEHNYAYARKVFLELAAQYGFSYVADADFSFRSGRVPEGLSSQLIRLEIDAESVPEAVDLLCYRQLHSPILTQPGTDRRAPDSAELSRVMVLSSLVEREGIGKDAALFEHPTGHEVRAEGPIATALRMLQRLWPRGLPIGELATECDQLLDDLRLLHRHGMIDLLMEKADAPAIDPEPLNRWERRWGQHTTGPHHSVIYSTTG